MFGTIMSVSNLVKFTREQDFNIYLIVMRIVLFLNCLVLVKLSVAQMPSQMLDTRDGRTYQTIIIDMELEDGILVPREWMTQNLNYESPGSFCYKGYAAYCEAFGRLYTWDEAVKVCPEGWHLPRMLEWTQIFKNYGGREVAAGALKEGGESELNITMGGFGELDGTYIDVGVNGYYWGVDDKNKQRSGLITFHLDADEIGTDPIGEHHKNSIRCVKDHEQMKVHHK